MNRAYERTLRVVLRHRCITMLVTAGTVAITAWLFIILPKGFIPTEDIGQISIITEGAAGRLLRLHGRTPAGGRRSAAGQSPHRRLHLQRRRRRPQFHRQRRPHASSASSPAATAPPPRKSSTTCARNWPAFPASALSPRSRPSIRIGGFSSKAPTNSPSPPSTSPRSTTAAPKVEGALRALPGLTDVTSDLQITSPQVFVKVNRDKASALGISAQRDRKRPLQRLRLPSGLHHLHLRRTSITSSSKSSPPIRIPRKPSPSSTCAPPAANSSPSRPSPKSSAPPAPSP